MFKLAMSVGKNKHYAVNDIQPRHFLQTAELAHVGLPLVQSIFDELAETALPKAESVVKGLPAGFPGQLAASILTAIEHRTRLLNDVRTGG
ncbi:hypothetical protein C0214_27485 (plasmid) [Methylobacterium sp. DM1]|nr:hypothetical protein C0214_27485 [Methylobacterium sp. DM1]